MNIIQKPYNQNTQYAKDAKIPITPKGICIHIAGGENVVGWANNPKNNRASWHYAVYKDGTVYSFIPDNRFAWANGMYWDGNVPKNSRGVVMRIEDIAQIVYDLRPANPNTYLISIEHQGTTSQPWTEAMYKADAELCIMLAKKYKFPLDRYNIIGHFEVDTVDRPNCPGIGFDFDRLFAEIKLIQDDEMYKEKYEHAAEKLKNMTDSRDRLKIELEACQKEQGGSDSTSVQLKELQKRIGTLEKANITLQRKKTALETKLQKYETKLTQKSKLSELIQKIINLFSDNKT